MKTNKYENWQTPMSYAASYEVAEDYSVIPYEVAQEIEASLTKQIVELKKELASKCISPSQIATLQRLQTAEQQRTPFDTDVVQLLVRLRHLLTPKN
jgi:hypothetical protein